MKEKLVIFDCDGVLVDSEYIACEIFIDALKGYGYDISLEECIRKFSGVNEAVCRQMIMKETGLAIPEDYWEKAQGDLVKAYERDLLPLMQPVLEMLERHNIPRCVASNSSQKHILHCLQFTDQLRFFDNDCIFNSNQVAKPKPAPDLFLFAANQMGVARENCIVIEDSLTGAEAAKAAGMQVLLFMGGRHARFDSYQNKMAACHQPMFFSPDELERVFEDQLSSSSFGWSRRILPEEIFI